jgi:hypothetical protein
VSPGAFEKEGTILVGFGGVNVIGCVVVGYVNSLTNCGIFGLFMTGTFPIPLFHNGLGVVNEFCKLFFG